MFLVYLIIQMIAATTTSLFGAPAAPAATGGLFGSAATVTPAAGGTSLFGTPAATTATGQSLIFQVSFF